jgi:hypothetical protein
LGEGRRWKPRPRSGTAHPFSLIEDEFHVLEGLVCDAILGESFLSLIDVYVQFPQSFYAEDPGENYSRSPLGVIDRVTPVEATLFGTQNQVPVYEKTDKEKFDERYTTEQERFEQDLSYVERQYYKTSALRNEKKKVYERHKTWIRDEDIQFQTYYPEYPDWCSEKLAKLDRERRGLN